MDYGALNKELKNIVVVHNDEGKYLEISINRPEVMNAITDELLQEIIDVLHIAETDGQTRCVVLRGTKNFTKKPAFSAGADLGAGGSQLTTMSVAEKEQFIVNRIRLYERINEFIKPMIALVDGFALGGGLELALTCDLILASSRSTFGFPEIKRGLFPSNGGTQKMVRHIGLARTKKMIYKGEIYPAKTMAEWGFIAEVFEDETFEEKSYQYISEIGNSPTIALIYAKRALNYGSQVPISIGMQFEAEGFGINSESKDILEGIQAFVEKRKPNYRGK